MTKINFIEEVLKPKYNRHLQQKKASLSLKVRILYVTTQTREKKNSKRDEVPQWGFIHCDKNKSRQNYTKTIVRKFVNNGKQNKVKYFKSKLMSLITNVICSLKLTQISHDFHFCERLSRRFSLREFFHRIFPNFVLWKIIS